MLEHNFCGAINIDIIGQRLSRDFLCLAKTAKYGEKNSRDASDELLRTKLRCPGNEER